MTPKLTPKQTELWYVADSEIRKLTIGTIRRDPSAQTAGSRAWALMETWAAARGEMPDDEACQYLINCIREEAQK